MSGHSKWATTKHRKAAQDAKRSALFSKLSRNITVAAKEGGDPNPDNNASLAAAIEKAKGYSLPKDKIKTAIDKALATGKDAANYETVTYEGYGPAGVAIMVKTLTNNRNRTAADLRHIFDKNGGNLGVDGSVSFLFNEKGTILISKEDYEDEDQVMGDALDCGASDFDSDDEFYIISTSTADYYDVRDALEAKNYVIADSTLGPVAMTTAEVTDPDAIAQLEKMLDMMDENEDIQEVFHNWNG